jgi:hypothetical protein
MAKSKRLIVKIDMEVLQAVARYYQFPSAVFFLPKEEWTKPRLSGTRLDSLIKDKQKLDAIRDICFGEDD